jgi:hypothetical protein
MQIVPLARTVSSIRVASLLINSSGTDLDREKKKQFTHSACFTISLLLTSTANLSTPIVSYCSFAILISMETNKTTNFTRVIVG